MIKTAFIVSLLCGLFAMPLFSAERDVIQNGNFQATSEGVFSGWEKLRDTTRVEAPLPEFEGAP